MKSCGTVTEVELTRNAITEDIYDVQFIERKKCSEI